MKREDLPPAMPHYDASASCREMLRGGSKSFFAASRLLGRDYREPPRNISRQLAEAS